MATTPQQPTITFAPTSPDVHVANRFAVSVTSTEFNLGVGRNRHVFQPNGEGVGAGTEYTHAFSLSPTAAKQLLQLLAYGVGQYEKAYGVIPDDPAVAKKIQDLAKASEKRATVAPVKRRAKRAK